MDLGFCGVDADNPGVEIIHRGRYKSLTSQHKRWLKRRQEYGLLFLQKPMTASIAASQFSAAFANR